MKTEITIKQTEKILFIVFTLLMLLGSMVLKAKTNDTCNYISEYLYQNNYIEVKNETYPESGFIKISAPTSAQLSYLWDNGSSQATRSGLTKGVYTLTITDEVGCIDTLDFSINCIEKDMLAYYPFNKNADNEMGTGHNGTNYGASDTTDRFNNDSSAFYFNYAEQDFIEIGDSLKPTEFPISIFAWVKLDSLTSDGQFIFRNDQWLNTAKYAGVKLSIGKDGRLSANFGSGNGAGGAHRYGKTSVDTLDVIGKWGFVGAVFHNTTDISIYLNGNEIDGTYAGNATKLGYTSNLGAIGYFAENRGSFAGKIDDIRFYDIGFSAEEVNDLYKIETKASNIQAGLIRHYKLDGNLTNEVDPSTNGDSLNAIISDRNGVEKQCYSFNQSNYLALPTLGNWGDYLTMSVWFKPENLDNGSGRSIIINSRTAPTSGYANFQLDVVNTDSTLTWNIWGTNVNHVGVTTTNQVSIGEWNHAVVMSNLETNEMIVILNGEKTITTDVLVPRYKDAPIFLGGVYAEYNQSPNNYIGKIDEFRIYNRILSDEEVNLLNEQEFAIGENYKLIGHYPLNGNANDYSGNEKHGTAYGAEITDRNLIPDQAYLTNGTNNITVPSLGNWGNELTISMWFKPDTLGVTQFLLGNREGSSGATKVNIIGSLQADSTIRFAVASDASGEPACYSSNKVIPGQWNHVVFQQDRVNENLSIVLNGTETAVIYTQTPRYLDLNLGLGNLRNGYNSTSGFHGKIDEVKIYQRVLSNVEIENLFTQEFPDIENMDEYQICSGDSIEINGNYYAEQGIIVDTLTSSQGADSIVVSNLIVNPLPEGTIAGDSMVCFGEGTLLTITGGIDYLWSTSQTASFVQVTPTTTELYWVEIINEFGCKSTDTIEVIVNELPVVQIAGEQEICTGEELTLLAMGAETYLWNTNDETAAITITPNEPSSYVVLGTDVNGCQNTDTLNVEVHALPNVQISGETAICMGSEITLLATGADNYVWNTTEETSSIVVSPTETTEFTVTGTNEFGCEGTDVHEVIVNSLPEITFEIAEDTICVDGNELQLSATPEGGIFTGTGVSESTFSPAVADLGIHAITYEYTDENNCTNTASDTIKVVDCSTGISQQISNEIAVYPNPAESYITIEFENVNNATLEIYDIRGVKVIQNSNYQSGTMLDINSLHTGIYFLKIETSDKGNITTRLVVK